MALFPSVQKVSYGVAMLSISLGLAMYAIMNQIKKNEALNRNTILTANRRNMHIFAVIAIPIAISWFQNETIYGSLSPREYWEMESLKGNNACDIEQKFSLEAYEEFQVMLKKIQMGLATSREMKIDMELLQSAMKIATECHSKAVQRQKVIEKRLSSFH